MAAVTACSKPKILSFLAELAPQAMIRKHIRNNYLSLFLSAYRLLSKIQPYEPVPCSLITHSQVPALLSLATSMHSRRKTRPVIPAIAPSHTLRDDPRTITWKDLSNWQQHNEYIVSGYRRSEVSFFRSPDNNSNTLQSPKSLERMLYFCFCL